MDGYKLSLTPEVFEGGEVEEKHKMWKEAIMKM